MPTPNGKIPKRKMREGFDANSIQVLVVRVKFGLRVLGYYKCFYGIHKEHACATVK